MAVMLRDKPLVSNGYTLAMGPDRLGMLVPTDPSRPMAELRDQYAQQGYLWLRGILDRDEVLAFRRRYFAAFAAPACWRRAATRWTASTPATAKTRRRCGASWARP